MEYLILDKYITNNYITNLQHKFRNNYNIFNEINAILNNNIVISGSTVLNTILNIPYYYNNITKNIDINIIANIYDINYIKLLNILDYNYLIKKKIFNKDEIYDDYLIDYDIYYIFDHYNKYIVKINLLHINISPKEYINIHNDLNIVKNYYNGKYIYSLFYLYIIKKYDNIKKIPNNENLYYRIVKYINRGFNISICHISIQTLYKNNNYPKLSIFRNDIANEIIKKYISNKKKKHYNVIYKKKHCIIC